MTGENEQHDAEDRQLVAHVAGHCAQVMETWLRPDQLEDLVKRRINTYLEM